MNLRTGDILKASINKLPIIYHYGIVAVIDGKTFIYHNTPNEKNNFNGNLIIDTTEKWTKTRKITKITKTSINKDTILKIYEAQKHKPFNLITWNCEHFIFQFKTGIPKSPQLIFWTIFIGIAIAYLMYFKSHKK